MPIEGTLYAFRRNPFLVEKGISLFDGCLINMIIHFQNADEQLLATIVVDNERNMVFSSSVLPGYQVVAERLETIRLQHQFSRICVHLQTLNAKHLAMVTVQNGVASSSAISQGYQITIDNTEVLNHNLD